MYLRPIRSWSKIAGSIPRSSTSSSYHQLSNNIFKPAAADHSSLIKMPPSMTKTMTTSVQYFSTPAASQKSAPSQKSLPKLPVPPLNDTLTKYLRSVKPLLSEEDYKKTSQAVRQFGTNPELGPKLQSLLENKANSCENWMSEWWLNSAYLEYRQPVIVYSSPGLVFPLQTFKSLEDQLSCAAKMISGAIIYKDLIDSGNIKTDMMGKTPLDMSQYFKIFGTTRNPAPGRDILVFNGKSRHIVVAFKNYFYRVNVYDSNGKMLNISEIYKQLRHIVESTTGLSGIPLGLLTSQNRDTWAEDYERVKKDPVNETSLKIIEESLFVLSIDRPNRAFNLPKAVPVAVEVEDLPKSERQTMAALQMLHGNRTNSGNRWFDKTIGLIVGTDGEVGLTYEHSPAEGPPIANMMDHIVQFMASGSSSFEIPTGGSEPKLLPQLLEFNLQDRNISKSISDAKDSLDTLIQDLDMYCFTFKKYGKDFIKSCKLSPDSFIQTAIQAAFYRFHKKPTAHYESASLRMYVGGRTETIRSCTSDSLEFSKALVSNSLSVNEKYKLMKKAVDSHKSYAADAVQGLGVDRHLFGLKKIAIENGMDIPEFFLDQGYVKSTSFRLSTSQVSSSFEAFMCYGPVVPNGYGCCYNPIKNSIVFGISAFNSSPETNSEMFKHALEDTLVEMQKVGAASTLQSKL